MVKNLPANAEEIRNVGQIPESGGGPGNPLQYSSLENPMDRGAQWAVVQGVTKESNMTQQQNDNEKEQEDVGFRVRQLRVQALTLLWELGQVA